MFINEDGIEMKQYAITLVTWVDAADHETALDELKDLLLGSTILNYDVLQVDEEET